MRPKNAELGRRLDAALVSYHKHRRPLIGLATPAHRDSFIEQIVESMRRIEFVTRLDTVNLGVERGNPQSPLFDPLKAAILRKRAGLHDDACWLVFLAIHFGKHLGDGWRLSREVYGALGSARRWDWERVSSNPDRFRDWIADNQDRLKVGGKARFGNHRKYVSLSATKAAGTGAAMVTYVRWINPPRTHSEIFSGVIESVAGNRREAFDLLYRSLDAVASFGRMAKFDYLTMLAKLGLADVEPGSTYMAGATGPYSGANLLFAGNKNAGLPRDTLDEMLVELEGILNVGPVGMQVMEDAVCNWQKSPHKFFPFRG